MTNTIMGIQLNTILADIYEIQANQKHFDNVGISIDYIDGDWMYGITVGGILERDFGSLEDLVEGLKEFHAELDEPQAHGSTPNRTVIDSQSI